MHEKIKTKNDVDFVVFWNNRNIRRKQPGDVILAFKHFVDGLPENQKQRVALLMHTQIVDENGTDLRAIWKTLAPDCKILFSEAKINRTQNLNAMYNVADVVVNIGSNEGWGLSSTEAILSGTPIINNVTGGLQDQCGFVDENGEWIRFDGEFATNHTGKYKNTAFGLNQYFQVIDHFKVLHKRHIFLMIDVRMKMLLMQFDIGMTHGNTSRTDGSVW
jgi:hypothetical protein